MRISGAWRIVGSVSYGSSDSTYGDVTVYTRLANHKIWLEDFLPPWSQARKTGQGVGWNPIGLVFSCLVRLIGIIIPLMVGCICRKQVRKIFGHGSPA